MNIGMLLDTIAERSHSNRLIYVHLRYDRKDTTRINLEDIQFISAMGPPGGGRNTITPRFTRHFIVVAINPFTDETLTKIFSTVFSVYIRVRIPCCFSSVVTCSIYILFVDVTYRLGTRIYVRLFNYRQSNCSIDLANFQCCCRFSSTYAS
jgi:hypothetical protein